jgi:protein TonB
MPDSTARAERIDLPSSEAAFYTWEVAQKPVAVRLPLEFIDRLESEAVENFRSLSTRGSEIGGLLLGSVTPGNPAVVTVTDFELIACDYSRGPLYRLSDGDLARFEQAIEKRGSGSGPRAIGFFRSHTRKGLSLDAEDLAFFEPRFLEPQHMVLLIRPFATKASMAGIFIRENGRIGGESSYLEFPFRSSELVAARSGGEKSEPASLLGTAAPAAAQPAMPPRPQSRAQIVPIAPRREVSLPEPATPAPLVAERLQAPAPPKTQPAAPVVEKSPVADKPKEKVAAPPPAPPAEPAVKPAAPAFAEEAAAAVPDKKNKKLRLIVAAAIGMLVLVGGSLVVYPMLRKSWSPPPRVAQQDSSPLSLRVERTPGGMLLTWNRDLPAIQSATKVVLSISDGDRHENIQLDPNQVRTGSILYPPITGDVSFQMEVTDPRQSKTTSESLRVLDSRPSPLADPSAALAGGKQTTPAVKPATPPTAAETASGAEEVKTPEETPVSHPTIPLKPFNTESLAQRLRPVSPTDLPDAPAIVRAGGGATSASLPGIVPTQPAVPAPPKSGSPNSAGAPEIGGQLLPAQVITRIDPQYPRIARQAGASGMVELEATIAVDGRVKNTRVISGNSMLQKAAIDAVLQWHYKPAMLNGKPVESPVEIKLNFIQGR